MISNSQFKDELKLCRIPKGCDVSNYNNWKTDIETNTDPTILQKILKAFGLYKCIDDALTDYALSDFATHMSTTYSYASVGTDGTGGTTYTLADLKAPVMSRVLCTKSFDTTYVTNDTAVFTAVMTADNDYTLCEFGLHTTSTGAPMGARQTSCTWDVVTGETFGMIWRVVAARG